MMAPFFPKRGLVKVRTFALDGTQDAPPCGLASSVLSELESHGNYFQATFAPGAGERNLTSTFRATPKRNWASGVRIAI